MNGDYMKKGLLFATLICLFAFCLAGCGNKEEEKLVVNKATDPVAQVTSQNEHEHEWTESTCEVPKTCKICGITEGEAPGHSWQEAACSTPKTCSVCGQTEGDALGHTVNFGICERCGDKANYTLYIQIMDCYDLISGYVPTALSFSVEDTTSYESYYATLSTTAEYFLKTKDQLDIIIEACGDYTELTGLKSAAQTMEEQMPTIVEGADYDSLLAFLNGAQATSTNYSNLVNEISDFKALYEDNTESVAEPEN
jgi:hypothetical protein